MLQTYFSIGKDYTDLDRTSAICHSPDSFADEIKYLYNVFNKNNYNQTFVRRNTLFWGFLRSPNNDKRHKKMDYDKESSSDPEETVILSE